jgi:hypothetical protein
MVDTHIFGNPRQPSAKISTLETADILEGANKSILRGVLGGGAVTKEASARTINTPPVPAVLTEPMRIAGRLEQADDFLIRKITWCSRSY